MIKLILLVCLPFAVLGQNTIGLPEVTNYTKRTYAAGLQNWDIKQDQNGIVYIANNEGLLSFDGKNWNLYPLPNKTIVRSVEIGNDNRVYVGGQDEIGYFTPAVNGRLQYHSLTTMIPAKDKSFGDVWDIVFSDKNIFFRSASKIFKLAHESVETFYAPREWSFLGIAQDKIFAHDYQAGLMVFENKIFSPIRGKNELPEHTAVTSILPISKDSSLVTTLTKGLFLHSPGGLSQLPTSNNQLFQTQRIYAASFINKESIALATNHNGVYIIDLQGNIIQSFSSEEGLQNDDVLSIFCDRQGNLWLGLDNGIDLIAYNNAIKIINPLRQNGAGYASIIFENRLFAGTNNGVYSVPLQKTKDLSFSKGTFTAVENARGQAYGLADINNQLLLGKHEGAYIIKGNRAENISTIPGFWNFSPFSNTAPSPRAIAGYYNGLLFFDYINGQFVESNKVLGFSESSRFLALDKDQNIWVSHPYHGVYKIIPNKNGTFTIHAFTEKDGLPSILNNHVFKIKNEIVVATEKGVFNFNAQKNTFEPSPYFNKILGDQSIRYLKEDGPGNIWFIHEKSLGVIDVANKANAIIYFPELNNQLLSGYETIYPVDNNNIIVGGEKGFFHINYEKYKKTIPRLSVQVRSVKIFNKTDSLLFGGYFKDVNEKQVQEDQNIPSLHYSWKTIRFEFASALFAYQSNLEYSYRLAGFDENWSAWTNRTEKEYTNLPSGKFRFEVKTRNNLGNESPPAAYSFEMLSPWYKTIWANIFYLLLLAMAMYFIYRWQQQKFKSQQLKHEEEQKHLRYIHELELSKTESELIALRNEKLANEIIYKTRELASANLHLAERSDTLNKVKEELQKIYKKTNENHDVKKTLKLLNDIEKNEANWDKFAAHFDEVNNDFLKTLKEKFPVLTNTDLKVCAYLQLNLSSKEIAQLMNISLRGVEISRYRLRKKLQIPTEVSLGDFLKELS